MIILDFGSGETCRNDIGIVRKMIDALVDIKPKKKVVIKWQLFANFPQLIPLRKEIFHDAQSYAYQHGIETTASVFDYESLEFLLHYDIPFVKIANLKDIYYLVDLVPRGIKSVVSYSDIETYKLVKQMHNVYPLACVRKYPSNEDDYKHFSSKQMKYGISDHTKGFGLYNKYKPKFYETHYKLNDSVGLDNGPWSKTPEQLKEILCN